MKKLSFTLIIALLAAGGAWAQTFTVGNLQYNIRDANAKTVEVTNPVEEVVGKLVIPSKVSYNGTDYIVEALGYSSFYNANNVTELVLPSTIIFVDDLAFFNCPKMEKLTVLAVNPPSYSDNLFPDLEYNRTPVYVPAESLEDYKKTLWGVFNLKANESPIIVDGLEYSITDTTARHMELIGYETMPEGTLDIPATVNYQGTDYTVTAIGSSAFEGCYAIEQVNIPAGVTLIGSWAFDGCSSLAHINVAAGNTTFSSEEGVLFNKDKTRLIMYPVARPGETYTVPDGVTNILSYAFERCGTLVEVTLPASLTVISNHAFAKCAALSQIVIPDGVVTIGSGAFMNCFTLSRVIIGSGVTSIDSFTFTNCSSLTEITVLAAVPPTITSSTFDGLSLDIPVYVPAESLAAYQAAYVWKEFTSLKGLSTGEFAIDNLKYRITDTTARHVELIGYETMPEGTLDIPATVNYQGTDYTVTAIGSSAFEGCYAIEQVNIPAGVTLIGSWAFDGCSSLAHINVAAGNTTFSSEEGVLFNKDKTRLIMYPVARPGETYTVPDGVTNILSYAFERCGTLVEVTLPASLTVISNHAFAKCAALSQIVIPDGVVTIGSGAFMNCFTLSRVIIGSGVTSIDSFTFTNCSSLTEITVLAAVPPTITSSTFDGLSLDIPVYVPTESLAAYQTADVWKEFTSLQAISSGLDTPSMPESISVYGGMLHNPEGLRATLYDLAGRIAYDGRDAIVDLPAGVYVVRCNGASGKVLF